MTEPTPLPGRIAALITLMRADPEAAYHALSGIRILSPLVDTGDHVTRPTATGHNGMIVKKVDNTWYGWLPGGIRVKIGQRQSIADFIEYVEGWWIADGWILL